VSVVAVSSEAFDAAYAQRWCGPGSAHGQASTSTTGRDRVFSTTQIGFPWQDDDERCEPEASTTIDHSSPPAPVALHHNKATTTTAEQHELRLIISGCRWVASTGGNIGTFWHEASDLGDGDGDVASFALLDTLTRWLPHWQGGILHVRTNDVCILRGIRGAHRDSGAVWHAVRSLCGQYDVRLSAEVVEPSSGILYARDNTRGGKYPAGTTLSTRALRNPDVVDAAVKWLMESGQQGSTAYRTMLRHLTV
jgi:hypothetical protein